MLWNFMGFYGLTGQEFIDPALQPVADFCLGREVHVGVNIHGNLDAGMPQLCLNILEVKDIGAFHAAGHIMAQHVEGGVNAQPVPRVAVIPAEAGGAYGLAVKPCKDKARIYQSWPCAEGTARPGLHQSRGTFAGVRYCPERGQAYGQVLGGGRL